MSLRRLVLLVAAAALAVGLAVPTAGANKPRTPKKTVTVGDDYFAPANFTGRKKRIKVGTKIVWKWSEDNSDTHDVKLTKAPKKVRHFHSRPATAGYSYSWTFKKPGTYRVICTFHVNVMKQNITVVK